MKPLNSLPERLALQLKLLPEGTSVETIIKARELCLVYKRANAASAINHVHVTISTCLDQMEATLQKSI